METYFSDFGEYLQNAWMPHYPLLLISIIVLGLALIRVTRGAMLYVGHMLLLFFLLLILLAYIAWVLLRLSAAGLDPGSLVASTAVVTAVVAFAMQDTLGNILSGLALQLDHSIHKDDWIEIDTIGGVSSRFNGATRRSGP